MTKPWFLTLLLKVFPLSSAFQAGPTRSIITHGVEDRSKALTFEIPPGDNIFHDGEVLNFDEGKKIQYLPHPSPGFLEGNGIKFLQGNQYWDTNIMANLGSATIPPIQPHLGDQFDLFGGKELPMGDNPDFFSEIEHDVLLHGNGQSRGIHQDELIETAQNPSLPNLIQPTFQDHCQTKSHSSEQFNLVSGIEIPTWNWYHPQVFPETEDGSCLNGSGKLIGVHQDDPIEIRKDLIILHHDQPTPHDHSISTREFENFIRNHDHSISTPQFENFIRNDHHTSLGQKTHLPLLGATPASVENFYPIIDSNPFFKKERILETSSPAMHHSHTHSLDTLDNALVTAPANCIQPTKDLMDNNTQGDEYDWMNLEDPQTDQSISHHIHNCGLPKENQSPLQAQYNTDKNDNILNGASGLGDHAYIGKNHQYEPVGFHERQLSSRKRKLLDMQINPHDIHSGVQVNSAVNTQIKTSALNPRNIYQFKISDPLPEFKSPLKKDRKGVLTRLPINHSKLGTKRYFKSNISFKKLGMNAIHLFQKMGSFKVDNDPILCYEIPFWFQNLSENLKKNLPGDHILNVKIAQALRSGQSNVTMSFLGLLMSYVRHGVDIAVQRDILRYGWEFIKWLFSKWEKIHLKEISFQGKIKDDKAFDCLKPQLLFEYLASSSSLGSIKLQLFTSLVKEWNSNRPTLKLPSTDIGYMNQWALGVYDPDLIMQGGFYSRAGIGNLAWEELQFPPQEQIYKETFQEISWHSKFLSPAGFQLCQDVHIFFSPLLRRLLEIYDTVYHIQLDTCGSIREEVLKSRKQPDLHQSNMLKIAKAVSMAEYRVTVGVIGIVRLLYKDVESEDELKTITSSAWSFLQQEFSKWRQLDFGSQNLGKLFADPTPSLKCGKYWSDMELTFKQLWSWPKYSNDPIPLQYVRYLLQSWTAMLKYKSAISPSGVTFSLKEITDRGFSELIKVIT
ncbi:uncharacterized protein MELLADRAFT_67914 [Melampsora larici-populina 98AG31]|uniref:Secreted protein n=1 Tax=Melampsora larici-populina (strain 98AG31 / pathotype 3-4-7) TaxID=747676 RepID=F4S4X3_MELLP|nr:uncharacterized protein MELLADRAFT_67914 [Melampsora larici-populina 98AG31]EGG00220.1 hypothetical protein MELLADRAFT_67914 [Melampsora larici-populina 98AG31]